MQGLYGVMYMYTVLDAVKIHVYLSHDSQEIQPNSSRDYCQIHVERVVLTDNQYKAHDTKGKQKIRISEKQK